MLDPQYLKESDDSGTDEEVSNDHAGAGLIKTETAGPSAGRAAGAGHLFTGHLPPVSPENAIQTDIEHEKRKKDVLGNGTKICLKFQLSNPQSVSSGNYFNYKL